VKTNLSKNLGDDIKAEVKKQLQHMWKSSSKTDKDEIKEM
jgi:hypothetical protein